MSNEKINPETVKKILQIAIAVLTAILGGLGGVGVAQAAGIIG